MYVCEDFHGNLRGMDLQGVGICHCPLGSVQMASLGPVMSGDLEEWQKLLFIPYGKVTPAGAPPIDAIAVSCWETTNIETSMNQRPSRFRRRRTSKIDQVSLMLIVLSHMKHIQCRDTRSKHIIFRLAKVNVFSRSASTNNGAPHRQQSCIYSWRWLAAGNWQLPGTKRSKAWNT